MSSTRVNTYKPFFFRGIDTRTSNSKVSRNIFNLDNYHKIMRDGNNIYAFFYRGDDSKRDYIACCNNEDGARWVLDCILRRQTTTEEEVLSVEKEGYDDDTSVYV